jgi:hypothetical protein
VIELHPAARLTLANLRELAVSVDQSFNVLACTVTLQQAYSDESLSAHAWRAQEKPFGRFFRPVIDTLFSWQRPDPDFKDESGNPITSHCRRAFEKERARRYSPPEERIDERK